MNILPHEKQIAAIAALTEGVSIRATERLTGIHRDTVMRLGVRVGEGCERLHDAMMRDLQVPILQFDEIWGYVGKKQRRFTRLTNGFSKKIRSHKAAVGLYVAHYNLCRVHEALRITPAMALGVADHIWTIGELVDATLSDAPPTAPGRRIGRFRVIDGGLS